MPIRCPQCQQPLPEDASFCANCGAPFEQATGSASDVGSAPGQSYGPKPDAPPPAPAYGASEPPGAVRPANTPLGWLLARVRRILVSPKTEWPVIASEATTGSAIYLHYVVPLVAVGATAAFIGAALIGIPVPTVGTVRLGVGAALAGTILHLVLTVFSVFVVALIIDGLAPTFGGQRDRLRALKVTAYSFTPAWVAAVLTIVPALGAIGGLLGLYALYLLYLGLPVLMRCPVDKSLGYTVVIVICAIVLSIAIAMVSGFILTMVAPADTATPGVGTASAVQVLGGQQEIGELGEAGAGLMQRDVRGRRRNPVQEASDIGDTHRIREEAKHRCIVG